MGNIKAALESKTDLLKGSGVSEDSIAIAEKKLNLSFSNEYREYLRLYGVVAFDGHELTGIVDDPRVDVVAVTKAEKEQNKKIPADFYVIEETDVDEIVIWQARDGRLYASSPNGEVISIYDSLCDYINKVC